MVILTGCIASFTCVSAFVTYRTWRERNEPNIEVRLESHPVYSSAWINICVENYGPGDARDLKFKITPSSTEKLLDQPVESLGFIKYGIGRLNSDSRRESMLTSVIGKFDEQQKYPITIEVKYRNLSRNSNRKPRKKTFILDFREFDMVSPIPHSVEYLQDISKTLEKTEKHIDRFLRGSATPRITIQSPLDANITQVAS